MRTITQNRYSGYLTILKLSKWGIPRLIGHPLKVYVSDSAENLHINADWGLESVVLRKNILLNYEQITFLAKSRKKSKIVKKEYLIFTML